MTDQARPVLIGYDGSDIAKQAISIAGELFPSRGVVIGTVYASAVSVLDAQALGAEVAMLGDAVDRFDDAAADAARTTSESGVELAAAAGLSARASTALSEGNAWRSRCCSAAPRPAWCTTAAAPCSWSPRPAARTRLAERYRNLSKAPGERLRWITTDESQQGGPMAADQRARTVGI
jgi:hypothetical protein